MENPAMIAAIVLATIYAYIYFYERHKGKKKQSWSKRDRNVLEKI